MKTAHRGFLIPLVVALVAAALLGGSAYVYYSQKSANSNVSPAVITPGSAPAEESNTAYATQEACELATKSSCEFVMCDYVPPDETPDQTCGPNFQKGWHKKQ